MATLSGVTMLVRIGVFLILLAVVVVVLAVAAVPGIDKAWAAPLLILGVLVAIAGAITGR